MSIRNTDYMKKKKRDWLYVISMMLTTEMNTRDSESDSFRAGFSIEIRVVHTKKHAQKTKHSRIRPSIHPFRSFICPSVKMDEHTLCRVFTSTRRQTTQRNAASVGTKLLWNAHNRAAAGREAIPLNNIATCAACICKVQHTRTHSKKNRE